METNLDPPCKPTTGTGTSSSGGMLELACTGLWALIMHIFSHLHFQWQHIGSLKSPQWEYLHHRNQRTLHIRVLFPPQRACKHLPTHHWVQVTIISHLVCGCNSHVFSLLHAFLLQSFSTWQATMIFLKYTWGRVITLLKTFQWLPIFKFKSKYLIYFTRP